MTIYSSCNILSSVCHIIHKNQTKESYMYKILLSLLLALPVLTFSMDRDMTDSTTTGTQSGSAQDDGTAGGRN